MDVLQSTRVESAFQKDEFGIDKLVSLKLELEASLQRQQLANRAKQTAEDVADDWGLYGPHTDKRIAAVKALNAAGQKLVFAIRNQSMTYIEAGFAAIRKLQRKYVTFGADDTEGRELLWALTEFACEETTIDPQRLWDQCY